MLRILNKPEKPAQDPIEIPDDPVEKPKPIRKYMTFPIVQPTEEVKAVKGDKEKSGKNKPKPKKDASNKPKKGVKGQTKDKNKGNKDKKDKPPAPKKDVNVEEEEKIPIGKYFNPVDVPNFPITDLDPTSEQDLRDRNFSTSFIGVLKKYKTTVKDVESRCIK
jgi:hypothetical protein